MKYIFISILFFASCSNAKAEKISNNVFIGKSFELNDMLCHWEYIFSDEVIIKLKNSQTNEILWEYIDWEYINIDHYKKIGTLPNYFDFLNVEDFNFDGFKDFSISYRGSMTMNDGTSIYIFNNETKRFEYSEELSDNSIGERDSINKILHTASFGWQWSGDSYYTNKDHHFDEFGKLKFSEILTEGVKMKDTIAIEYEIYQKIINGEIVEERYYLTSEDERYRSSEFTYFEKDFFPFDFTNYSTEKLMPYFYDGVTVDSLIFLENVELGQPAHKIYTYKLEDSYISFFVKDDDNYFYLWPSAEIKQDMFKSKNDVSIGITNDDFYKKIKTSPKDYERFTIFDGEIITYQFDFKDSFLQSVFINNGL